MKYLGGVLVLALLVGCDSFSTKASRESADVDMKLLTAREKTEQLRLELEKDRLGKAFALCMKMIEQQKETKMPINCNLRGN